MANNLTQKAFFVVFASSFIPHASASLREQAQLAPGVTWSRTVYVDLPGGANQTVNILQVELDVMAEGIIDVRPIVQDEPGICYPLSALASSAGALAAVNGGFFHYNDGEECTSLSIVKLAGQQLYDNVKNRTALGIDYQGGFHFEEVDAYAQWPEMYHALGGGPNLVTNGLVDVHPVEEEFGLDISGRNPRTALCLAKSDEAMEEDDLLLMVTVDGRSEEGSGMSLFGLAESLIVIGCNNAMNLDGGGSTTLWTSQFGVMNYPSDEEEREIPTALGVFLLAK